ncbi:hypothetical protein [Gallaecimonas sp. GXIMD4217]|uniref:hypothetical protein n=1 Tax=Gallaecimonas sp. GXIMD4217 TaxID=3131927 RepID=UPI00311B37A2
MYSQPFKVMKERIPFLEYLTRVAIFMKRPDIVEADYKKEGGLSYALLDIVYAVTLISFFIAVIDLVFHRNLSVAWSLFSSQFTILAQITYYALFSTVAFFLLLYMVEMVSKRKINVSSSVFLCSLQYARFYSVFIFFFFPIVVFYMNLLLIEQTTMDKFVEDNFIASVLVTSFFVWLYLRCCVFPIASYSQPLKEKYLSAALIALITWSAFSANKLAPRFGELAFDTKKACGIIYKQKKFQALDPEKQMNFKESCEATRPLQDEEQT